MQPAHADQPVQVRPTTVRDLPGIIALHKRAFPGLPHWELNELLQHLRTFPEGQFCAVTPDLRVVGSATSLILPDDRDWTVESWGEITGEGLLTSHDPQGDTLYGADICVDPAFRRQRIGSQLYRARRQLVKQLNLRRMLAGGRIPGYRRYADEMAPEAYVEKVQAGDLEDPVLSFQLANGFQVVGVIPHYLKDDRQSREFATLIEWRNPDYEEIAHV